MKNPLLLEIPAHIRDALRLPPKEVESRLLRELAVGLYAKDLLSIGKAAELAGMDRWAFGELLGREGVPRHYSEEDLMDDIAYVRDRQ
jgi:predicted HTH domain antitoxin